MNEILLLILCELVSAAFIGEVWFFKGRITAVERCLLTALLLLPIVGWLGAWEFLQRRAKSGTGKAWKAEGMGTNLTEPVSVWLLYTFGAFVVAASIYKTWASAGPIGRAGQSSLVLLVGMPALGGILSGLFPDQNPATKTLRRLRPMWPVLRPCLVVGAIMLLGVGGLYLIWSCFAPVGIVGRGVLGLLALPAFLMLAVVWGLLRKFYQAPPVPVGPPAPSLDEAGVRADPDRLELLWLIRGEMDEALLDTMSKAEGGPDHALHRAALAEILRTGVVPKPLGLWPGMVCDFLTHSASEPGLLLSPEERQEHLIDLFASWIMLNASVQPESKPSAFAGAGFERWLLTLTANSLALGPEFIGAAARLVAWARARWEAAPDLRRNPGKALFSLLSLLILRCASPCKEDLASAPAVYDALAAEEQEIRRQQAEATSARLRAPDPTWLFGLSYDWPAVAVKDWAGMAAWALDRKSAAGATALDPRLAEFKQRMQQLPQ